MVRAPFVTHSRLTPRSSTIVNDLLQTSTPPDTFFAYFYFDFNDESKQTLRGLLSSLLIQLSWQSRECMRLMSQMYRAHGDGGREPNTADLQRCLLDMLAILPSTYIVLDALDECPALRVRSERQEILGLIRRLLVPKVHICVTSRPEPDIKEALLSYMAMELDLHSAADQARDIARHITIVLDEDPVFRRWPAALKQYTLETLEAKANGM